MNEDWNYTLSVNYVKNIKRKVTDLSFVMNIVLKLSDVPNHVWTYGTINI